MFIIAILFGAFGGHFHNYQLAYCACYKDDFKGAYCQSIKGEGKIVSCHLPDVSQ